MTGGGNPDRALDRDTQLRLIMGTSPPPLTCGYTAALKVLHIVTG